MYCHVYKGDKRDDHYLYLDRVIDDAEVPKALLSMLGNLSKVIQFELNSDRQLPQADSEQVMKDINEHGFYLQMPKKDMLAEEAEYFN
jgi:uncharacterized protein YcgL (UPF0745 family)